MKKTSNKIYKSLVVFCLVVLAVGVALKIYNNYTEKKAVNNAISTTENAFNRNVKYHRGTGRIVVELNVKNEGELFKVTKNALPHLVSLNYGDIVKLLSVRTYYNGDKNNVQHYDIYFKDIGRLNWDKINNFNDFLNYINALSFN